MGRRYVLVGGVAELVRHQRGSAEDALGAGLAFPALGSVLSSPPFHCHGTPHPTAARHAGGPVLIRAAQETFQLGNNQVLCPGHHAVQHFNPIQDSYIALFLAVEERPSDFEGQAAEQGLLEDIGAELLKGNRGVARMRSEIITKIMRRADLDALRLLCNHPELR